jgi:hypothetical protein
MNIENLPKYKIGDSIVYKKRNYYVMEKVINAYLPEGSNDWEYWTVDYWIKQSEILDVEKLPPII